MARSAVKGSPGAKGATSMNLQQNNEELAIKHMQRFCLAAFVFKDRPNADSARTMRVQAKLLRQLASQNDPTINWAANEAEQIIKQFGI